MFCGIWSLPKLPKTNLDMRVACLVNDRLPRMSPERLSGVATTHDISYQLFHLAQLVPARV